MLWDGITGVAGCFADARARPVKGQGRATDQGEVSMEVSDGLDELINTIRVIGVHL